jgi:hypothetical protein
LDPDFRFACLPWALFSFFFFRWAPTAHETTLVFVNSEGRFTSELITRSYEAVLEVLKADEVDDGSAVVK